VKLKDRKIIAITYQYSSRYLTKKRWKRRGGWMEEEVRSLGVQQDRPGTRRRRIIFPYKHC
jgi:hypothetical protein